MKKTILVNLLVIVVMMALAATATWAYFGAVKTDQFAEVTTAKIEIDEVYNFPLVIHELLPGTWKESNIVAVHNNSTVPADFYLQMKPEADGDTNYCYGPQGKVVTIAIDEVTSAGDLVGRRYEGSICDLYPIEATATVAKLGESVAPDTWKYFKVWLLLDPMTSDPYYMGGYTYDEVHLIAVQDNGPAPVVDTVPDHVWVMWPESDPNY